MAREKIVYEILYKFLKSNRIFDKYINNVKSAHKQYEGKDAKFILTSIVHDFTTYYSFYGISTYEHLFSFAQTGFFFDKTIEGYQYWSDVSSKWKRYYIVIIRKYKENQLCF